MRNAKLLLIITPLLTASGILAALAAPPKAKAPPAAIAQPASPQHIILGRTGTPSSGGTGGTVGGAAFSGSILTPILDALSAGPLTVGPTVATSIALRQNTTLPTSKTLVVGSNTLISSDKLAAAHLLIASQAIGDLLYASSTTAWARLATTTAGSYLLSGTTPAWSTLKLPNSATAGDIAIATATNTIGSLAAVASGQVLVSAGTGTAPAYTASPTVSHLIGGGTAESAPSAGAGCSAATGLTASGKDLSGQVGVTCNAPGDMGAPAATSSPILTLTFKLVYGAAPHCNISPLNAATAAIPIAQAVYYSSTTTTLVINSNTTALDPGTYLWSYNCTQ